MAPRFVGGHAAIFAAIAGTAMAAGVQAASFSLGPPQEKEARSCVTFLRGYPHVGTRLKNLCNIFISVRYCYEPSYSHRCDLNAGIWDYRELGPSASFQVAWIDSTPFYGFACRMPYRARLLKRPRGTPTELVCEPSASSAPQPVRPSIR